MIFKDLSEMLKISNYIKDTKFCVLLECSLFQTFNEVYTFSECIHS